MAAASAEGEDLVERKRVVCLKDWKEEERKGGESRTFMVKNRGRKDTIMLLCCECVGQQGTLRAQGSSVRISSKLKLSRADNHFAGNRLEPISLASNNLWTATRSSKYSHLSALLSDFCVGFPILTRLCGLKTKIVN